MSEILSSEKRNETVQANLGKFHSATLSDRRDFVLSQYERLWTGVYEKAKQVLASGERDLSRVHLFMRRNFGPEFENKHLQAKYADHEKQKSESGFLFDRQLINIKDTDSRVVSLMTDALKMREAIDAFGPNIERIVEIGAGWGKTLFNLYKFGAPLKAEYFSLELTETGRAITELIAKETANGMKISTHPYDHYESNFGMLSDPKMTGIITHHTMEQIPQVPEKLIESILAIPGFTRCVHLEPCGFQISTNNWLANGDTELMREIDGKNRKFTERKNQNRNLYPLLRNFEKEGKIRIYTVRKYLCSHLLDNATTLIVWGPSKGNLSGSQLANHRRDDLLSNPKPTFKSRLKRIYKRITR